MTPRVHVVSHGPHCLDGVAAAVAVARYYEGEAEVVPHFASNSEVDAVLRGLVRDPSRPEELWITDISWKEPDTDAHLARLAAAGMRIHWVDHHRSALERFRTGAVQVPLAERVLSEEYAASRLVYEHLARTLAAEGRTAPQFAAFAPVLAMSDDNDRWLHRVPGSRELAWVVRALGPDAYPDLLAIDERVTYTPRMEAARARVGAEIARSLAVARASRVERRVGGLTLVSAVCDGHPSEVADAWGRETPGAVFALYDAKSLTVSLRRSPDATVDLSRLASALGGGGHARTIYFYRRHAHLHVVHDRTDPGGTRVVWLSERPDHPTFVLVCFEVAGPRPPAPSTLQHLGFALASRAEVDAVAAAARREGVLALEPTDGGPVVGYFCLVRDPDGNAVEFSHGQPIDPMRLAGGTVLRQGPGTQQ